MTFEQRTFGNYGVCCRSYPLPYTMSDMSIEEHFNSNLMKQIRAEMESGVPGETVNKYCNKCIYHEKTGVTSRRQHRIEQLNSCTSPFLTGISTIIQHSLENVHINLQDMKFYSMEFKFFGNLCNLKCMMCHPHQSSSLAVEWKKDGRWKGPTHINTYHDINQEKFWEEMDIMLPNTNELKFTGGEPLMNNDILDMLNYCVEKGYSQSLVLVMITNGTKLPDNFLSLLGEFKSVKMNISLDGVFEVNDYQRVGSKFEVIDKHINELLKYKNVDVQLTTAITAINAGNIRNIINYAKHKKIYADISNIVLKPNHISLHVLPKHIRELFAERLNGIAPQVEAALRYDDPEAEKLFPAFIQSLRNKDTRDGTNFLDIIPELKDELRETIDVRTVHTVNDSLQSIHPTE